MKKIDKNTLEKLQLRCYEVALMGIIDSQTMAELKVLCEKYLAENEFNIDYVKCDFENNPPDVIDRNSIIIDISEIAFPGSHERYKHRIVL